MLRDQLLKYASTDACPMHMPGHKRNTALLGEGLPYSIDITEIDGFDNLHDPHGVLLDTAGLAAALYGSRRAFLLINGSTAGILAAIRGTVKRGEKIIMARNCHKSVYHAAELNLLKTVYLMPEADGETGIGGSVTAAQVERALREHPDAKPVVITSPTYEGVVSDICAISDAAHRRGVPVLVDEAHGAHLGFSGGFPAEALKSGADLVIMSLHKTLPALTQCALAHVGGSLVDAEKIAGQLAIFETSSPSYVLMSSIDDCVRRLAAEKNALFTAYEQRMQRFDDAVRGLEKLRVLCHGADRLLDHETFFRYDPGKVVICTGRTGLTGSALTALLRDRYRIELEMAYAGYAIGMTSICDPEEHVQRLADALIEIDRCAEANGASGRAASPCPLPPQEKPIWQAVEEKGIFLPLEDAAGAMSLEYVCAYPPGIPLITPGERIEKRMIRFIGSLAASSVGIHSTKGKMPRLIYAGRG